MEIDMADGSKGTMRAFALAGFDGAPSIHELPIPEPAARQLLVRVQAASINGYDAAVAAGMVRDFFEYRFPVTIGKDFAGTVEALGDDAGGFARGAEVVGILPQAPHVHEGTFADYVSVPAGGFVAAKPANLGFTEAAAVGLAGTAAQVAVDAVHP